jgi:hypothetical protein
VENEQIIPFSLHVVTAFVTVLSHFSPPIRHSWGGNPAKLAHLQWFRTTVGEFGTSPTNSVAGSGADQECSGAGLRDWMGGIPQQERKSGVSHVHLGGTDQQGEAASWGKKFGGDF